MDVDFWPLLFSFQGRINRAKYWIATITYISATIALVGLGFFFRFDTIFFIIAAIVFVALTVSGVAVGLKRLHDRDMSGWWLLVFYLLPAVLDGIGRELAAPVILSLGAAISVWALVVLGFLRGTSGPNQYGPDPLGT
jgi:uncharacterized membrane protein YhaH (DUF805 family)